MLIRIPKRSCSCLHKKCKDLLPYTIDTTLLAHYLHLPNFLGGDFRAFPQLETWTDSVGMIMFSDVHKAHLKVLSQAPSQNREDTKWYCFEDVASSIQAVTEKFKNMFIGPIQSVGIKAMDEVRRHGVQASKWLQSRVSAFLRKNQIEVIWA